MNVRVNLYALLFHITQFEIKMENGKLYRNSPFSIFNSQLPFIHADLAQLFDHIRHGLTGDLEALCGAGLFFGERISCGDKMSGRLHAVFFQQGNETLCSLAVNGQNLVLLYEKFLLGGQRANGECRKTVLIQQLAVAV